MSPNAKVGQKKSRQVVNEEVELLLGSADRRKNTPIRKSFVQALESVVPSATTPLSEIVSTRGRGGAVALKVYLGLLRRSSAPPFDTTLPARRWAMLLALEDPLYKGARRVNNAISRLQELQLIQVEARRGEASTITLLKENGSGEPYLPPASSFINPRSGKQKQLKSELYFKMPDELWKGHIQCLSASALAMLLILLAESSRADSPSIWWAVSVFPARYGISASMRANGTRELCDLGLLEVTKQKIDSPRGSVNDERDRVRNLYRLSGAANGMLPKRSPNPIVPKLAK